MCNSRLDLFALQNLEGIVPLFFLAFMLLLRSLNKFRILILCMWHIFFFLAACETLYWSLMCWNFTVINLEWVFHPLCRTCVGLSYSLVWETFLGNFIFSSSCSGASTIWMWKLLVWYKFLICLLLFFFYVSDCSVSRETSLFYCRIFFKFFFHYHSFNFQKLFFILWHCKWIPFLLH